MAFELTATDVIAIQNKDSIYINKQGADAYGKGEYETALEYYRLAAAMGNMQSVSNLGYCYMYGRSIEKNIGLAVEYFKIAANAGVIDALYKLGNIYFNGTAEITADKQIGLYYYDKALKRVDEFDLDPCLFPSLYYALGKERMPGGALPTNPYEAYDYLTTALAGYTHELSEGAEYYRDVFKEVTKLVEDPYFDDVRDMFDMMDEDDFDDDDDF